MKKIFDLLYENTEEAKRILKTKENNTIDFAVWNDDAQMYVAKDGNELTYDEAYCDEPWVRVADDDGNIQAMLVISARYNEAKDKIEIKTTRADYEECDEDYFDMHYCDDISYWHVLQEIGEHQ